MQTRLPEDKLKQIHNQVASWLFQKKATKREILSLVGHLQHATKVVILGELSFPECMRQQSAFTNYLISHISLVASAQTLGGGISLPPTGIGLVSLTALSQST